MSPTHCEECWAVLDPTKILRCTKCKACRYCSRECQTRNWRLHKRVCTTDPALRRFVPAEMAIERVSKKCPKMEEAPKDATCYICLEGNGDGKSSKLMRGCACRGDSAGFVHLECLTKLAISKEASGDLYAILGGWTKCGNCKQYLTGALEVEMTRGLWRRYRSIQDLGLRYNSTKFFVICLGDNGEIDVVNQLLDEASTCVGNDTGMLMELKLLRAQMLRKRGQNLEALGLLKAILPLAKAYTARPQLYMQSISRIADQLLDLDRYQEAHEAADKGVAFGKAKFGLEDIRTLTVSNTYAVTCTKLGRFEEAKANFEDTLTIQTRVFGREHLYTQSTRRTMRILGFEQPSG